MSKPQGLVNINEFQKIFPVLERGRRENGILSISHPYRTPRPVATRIFYYFQFSFTIRMVNILMVPI
jgi:hypothetical protein